MRSAGLRGKHTPLQRLFAIARSETPVVIVILPEPPKKPDAPGWVLLILMLILLAAVGLVGHTSVIQLTQGVP